MRTVTLLIAGAVLIFALSEATPAQAPAPSPPLFSSGQTGVQNFCQTCGHSWRISGPLTCAAYKATREPVLR